MKGVAKKDLIEIRKIIKAQFGYDDECIIEQLGGMTNRTYKVSIPNMGKFVFRIPGEGTDEIISRKEEEMSTILAQNLDIDAPMIFWRNDGFKINIYIEDAKTMNARLMKDHFRIREAARILHKLHNCGINTNVKFDILYTAQKYENLIKTYQIPFFPEYDFYKSKVLHVKQDIDKNQGNTDVPCHNDPLCENWIEGNGRLYLIDWEYAGMNDAMWDLADLSIEAAFEYSEEKILLEEYFNNQITLAQMQRFDANKIFVDYLWTLWGKTRVITEGVKMDEYSCIRYERLKKHIISYENQYSNSN